MNIYYVPAQLCAGHCNGPTLQCSCPWEIQSGVENREVKKKLSFLYQINDDWKRDFYLYFFFYPTQISYMGKRIMYLIVQISPFILQTKSTGNY